MASLKEIRGRIGSVKGTLKITSAMRLISSAKLHTAQGAIGNLVPYEFYVQDILVSLMGCGDATAALAPYLSEGESREIAVILITSNQTLCGAFNVNIMKAFESRKYNPEHTTVYAVGKYGMKQVQKLGFRTVDCCELSAHANYDSSNALAEKLSAEFTGGKIGRVDMVYAHYASPVSQPIQSESYLPLNLEAATGGAHSQEDTDYIVEPSAAELLERMLPMVLRLKMHTVMLDSAAAEHAARTLAMQMASENAEELIAELSLQYNKLRQQAITSEILDLLGGQANNN
ncbi:MAG: ATP synthase F1 subunit gamma [Bacteroidales bacterium]|nr:ATP synthase F1 subunit gamma [Bacteroidales bacterium]